MKQNWGSTGIGANGQNFLRYSNRKVDALLDSSTSAFDPAKMNGRKSERMNLPSVIIAPYQAYRIT